LGRIITLKIAPYYLFLIAVATPRSLLSQARLVIRRALRQANQPQAIDQLDIPPMLIGYLKHQL
jgi:ankyrin repeat/SOCS box protein 12